MSFYTDVVIWGIGDLPELLRDIQQEQATGPDHRDERIVGGQWQLVRVGSSLMLVGSANHLDRDKFLGWLAARTYDGGWPVEYQVVLKNEDLGKPETVEISDRKWAYRTRLTGPSMSS